jgi:cytochrome b
MNKSSGGGAVRVWDLPTRLFHWALVVLLVFSYVTGQLGRLEWHMVSGKLILSMLLFRLAWGFIGNEHARFGAFLKGPGETIRYALSLVRGATRRYLGHNPIGGWSAIAMLAVALLQACTGLFATDDIYTDGPLRHLVSDAIAKRLTTIHRYAIDVLLVLVALHVLAVMYYLHVKKDNLVRPMFTGRKQAGADAPVNAPRAGGSPVLASILFAGSLALVFGGLAIYGT